MREDGDGPRAGSGFFQNRACPYFPCHRGVAPARFNCLFCYCPLYALGPGCGGDFRYTAQGVKDCSPCVRLHDGDGGAVLVRERFGELAALAGLGGLAEVGEMRPASATEQPRLSAKDRFRRDKRGAPAVTTSAGTGTGCENGGKACVTPEHETGDGACVAPRCEAGDGADGAPADGTRP